MMYKLDVNKLNDAILKAFAFETMHYLILNPSYLQDFLSCVQKKIFRAHRSISLMLLLKYTVHPQGAHPQDSIMHDVLTQCIGLERILTYRHYRPSF